MTGGGIPAVKTVISDSRTEIRFQGPTSFFLDHYSTILLSNFEYREWLTEQTFHVFRKRIFQIQHITGHRMNQMDPVRVQSGTEDLFGNGAVDRIAEERVPAG